MSREIYPPTGYCILFIYMNGNTEFAVISASNIISLIQAYLYVTNSHSVPVHGPSL